MAKFTQITGNITIKINTGISLWQAIKLRIAGRNYYPIVKKISDELVKNIRIKNEYK